jgi:hypothetical protein
MGTVLAGYKANKEVKHVGLNFLKFAGEILYNCVVLLVMNVLGCCPRKPAVCRDSGVKPSCLFSPN